MSAGCNYPNEDSVLPQKMGDRGPILPDDHIPEEWLSGP